MKNTSVILLNAFPEKKIKTLGNKGLIDIQKNKKLIDYHIEYFKPLASNITIVDGYDNKKMQKYLENKGYLKNKKIKYLYHDIGDGSNVGTSIIKGIKDINPNFGLLIHNTSIVLGKKTITKLNGTKHSFCLVQKNKNKNDIGCYAEKSKIVTCFYGLPLKLLDSIYIDKNKTNDFIKMINNTNKISNMFLFEIINIAIESSIQFEPLEISNNQVKHITSSKAIHV